MMNKTLTYSSFAIVGILMVFTFLTAKTYTQLIIATLVYPIVAFLAFKLFPLNKKAQPEITIQPPAQPKLAEAQVVTEKVEVADIEKRTFLKILGTAGVSFLIFSILGRRIETLLFGRSFDNGIPGLGGMPKDETTSFDLQTAEGFNITEIDDQNATTYYGFTNKHGSWLIMKEQVDDSSFRYAKGDSGFPTNWANRANLKYDYYYNLF